MSEDAEDPEDAPAEDADAGEPEDAEETAGSEYDLDEETFEERLEAAADEIEAADTEADLDAVEETLDAIEADLEEADLPEPEDEDEESPTERFEAELSDLRGTVEDERGPYASDVVDTVESVKSTVEDTRWTERGEGEVVAVLGSFAESVNEILNTEFTAPDEVDATVLGDAIDAVDAADLDADEDADTIASLLDASEELESGIEDAESWDDLSVREQLQAEGYYDVLGEKYKDYPPEWSAMKEWQKRNNAEMVLLILDKMGQSDHIERHALDALRHMGNEESLDAMKERAARRDIPAIRVIGKIGSSEGVEAIRDYTDSDSNPKLQKAAIKSLGEIGDHEVTQDIANELDAENEGVRSEAARALGLLGDTRAIEPLADVLADTEEADSVRASAAWALTQIGTERALEAAAEYAGERSYIVQKEAEAAADALETDVQTA